MLVAELFFGRDIAGRRPLGEAEWAAFVAEVVTPNFPDGFTVFDATGQWRNPATGMIAREPSKVLLVMAKRSPDLAARLAAVIAAYKSRFHQQSVGVVTRDSCAGFSLLSPLPRAVAATRNSGSVPPDKSRGVDAGWAMRIIAGSIGGGAAPSRHS